MYPRQMTLSHWGAYEVVIDQGVASGLVSSRDDPDPSPIGLAMWDAYQSPLRIGRPAVRRSWLDEGAGARPELRGREEFVEVEWERALDLVAAELDRVRRQHGNGAIFGGSYGWSSAGRFHHAQSQVHRFLNVLGGYVRSVDTYSLGAARVVLPHVVAPMEELMESHHGWDVLAQHTRLFVSFGGVPAKNAQVTAGGAIEHRVRPGLARLAAAGCRLVNISPVRDNFDAPEGSVEWIPIRPNTDTAAMLAMACELIVENRHDRGFLATHCVGYETWRDYLLGRHDGVRKDAQWAAPITGIPADTLRTLARDLAATRSLVNAAWALQRAAHGEQPYWAVVGLASVLGQIGLPGGGFGVGYGAANVLGSPHRRLKGPTFPQGENAVSSFIPVARIADMLLHPGERFEYNGESHHYPDIDLVYWAGGNAFHHHQDLNRLALAWRKPSTIVVHEQFWNPMARMADIVLPATSTLERDDIGFSTLEPQMIAMKAVLPSQGDARDDHAIFAALSERLGAGAAFTEGRSPRDWLTWMYDRMRQQATAQHVNLPDFESFWSAGLVEFEKNAREVVMLEAFRRDPVKHRLRTPSGLIELHSGRVASFGYEECPGHAVWREPFEWLGAAGAQVHPLHLLSDQPGTRLHSQLDHSAVSLAEKIDGRQPAHLNPADARERGIADGDVVRVFNDRGATLAAARVSDGVMPGVVRLSTGSWWDPEEPGTLGSLDRAGNPNTLTLDRGTSRLAQGCAAQTCLVQIERWTGPSMPVRSRTLPDVVPHEGARQA